MNTKNQEIEYDQLQEILKEFCPKRIVLVTGKKSFKTCGAEQKLLPLLTEYNILHISDFDQNPKLQDLENCIAKLGEVEKDFYIAVGGGSAIDMAKMINVMSHQPVINPGKLLSGDLKTVNSGASLVCIPTTFGTGSESTHFAVGYIGTKKYSFATPYALPEYYILDPKLAESGPVYLKACVGLDALCQAIESYWAKGSTEESRSYSEKAITTILPNIYSAVVEGNYDALAKMSQGANSAGRAINIAKTTASHALSYAITERFGIPHGHAVALTLPQFFQYNWEHAPNEAVRHRQKELHKLLGVQSAIEARDIFISLLNDLNLKNNIYEFGITQLDEMRFLVDSVNLERLDNHPVPLSKHDLIDILKK